MGCSDLRLVLSKESFSYWYYPSSVAQIVHSVTLEVILLSVSSSLADTVGLFYGRRKIGDPYTTAQTMPIPPGSGTPGLLIPFSKFVAA